MLAVIAAASAPGDYQSAPAVEKNMNLLRAYLVHGCGSQELIDRVLLLWASTKTPGLLTSAQQKSITDEALSKQQADGGCSLSSFVGEWKRRDDTPLKTRSDGYAPGVVALALQESGMKRDQPQLQRALAWLETNQEKTDGRWLAYSLNKQRDLSSYIGRFMSDAATAYAVLALCDRGSQPASLGGALALHTLLLMNEPSPEATPRVSHSAQSSLPLLR